TFDAIWAVTVSRSGQYWAAAGRRGEVRLWREFGQTLHLAWQAHTDIVMSLAFSPDERRLASGSFDGSVKLWDVESRALLWSGRHPKSTLCLALAPDGQLLASGGLMAPCGAGRRSWAPPCRSCRIPVRSSRWPGAPMGAYSPVATHWARSGCGSGSRAGRLGSGRRL